MATIAPPLFPGALPAKSTAAAKDDAANGLTGDEAGRRLAKFGPNAMPDTSAHAVRRAIEKFWAPVPWMLEAAIVLQVALGDYTEAAIIAGLLVFNAALGLFQEGRAQATLAALKSRLALNASVRRDGAWKIVPAAELSEQISTAGYEASGTGNMKLAMNGALTIGTLDGANVEIARDVGADNIYIFGLTAEQIVQRRLLGNAAREVYDSNPDVRRIMMRLLDGTFSADDPGLFAPIAHALLDQGDHYMHLSDFADYAQKHEQAARDYRDPERWTARAIANVARSAHFSSDRTIHEYATQIWDLQRVV